MHTCVCIIYRELSKLTTHLLPLVARLRYRASSASRKICLVRRNITIILLFTGVVRSSFMNFHIRTLTVSFFFQELHVSILRDDVFRVHVRKSLRLSTFRNDYNVRTEKTDWPQTCTNIKHIMFFSS